MLNNCQSLADIKYYLYLCHRINNANNVIMIATINIVPESWISKFTITALPIWTTNDTCHFNYITYFNY